MVCGRHGHCGHSLWKSLSNPHSKPAEQTDNPVQQGYTNTSSAHHSNSKCSRSRRAINPRLTANLHSIRVIPNTHRWCRRDARHSDSRRSAVSTQFATSSRRLPTGAFTPPTRRNSTAVGKFVQTRRDCRQIVANSIHTADATQLDSCIASVVCIGLKPSNSGD